MRATKSLGGKKFGTSSKDERLNMRLLALVM
jgi:hypothetical protein